MNSVPGKSGKYARKVERGLCGVGVGNGNVREKDTYDGIKEEMSVMGIADADATGSGLLRGHSWRKRMDGDRRRMGQIGVRGWGGAAGVRRRGGGSVQSLGRG